MNCAQLIKKARLNADAIRINKSVSPLWTDEEMIDLVNEVNDMMMPTLRLVRRHYHQRRMTSQDVATTILGQTYDPINLRLDTGDFLFTLPPDFVEVIRLTPLITATVPDQSTAVNVRFWPRDVADPTFVAADLEGQMLSSQSTPYGQTVFFYDLVGPRTLRIAPKASTQLHVELLYWARQSRITMMTVGTLNVSGTAVAGQAETGQDFTQVFLPAELIVGSNGTAIAPGAVPEADINATYATVASIQSATGLTLNNSQPTRSYAGYILAGVPEIPEQHHRWMAVMMSDLMLRKVSVELARARLELSMRNWKEGVQPDLTAPRQSQEPIYTIPFLHEDL